MVVVGALVANAASIQTHGTAPGKTPLVAKRAQEALFMGEGKCPSLGLKEGSRRNRDFY